MSEDQKTSTLADDGPAGSGDSSSVPPPSKKNEPTDNAVEPPADDVRLVINPVGIGLAVLGALAAIVAVFLPLVDATASPFSGIAANSLVQEDSGEALLLIGLSVAALITTYRYWRRGRPGWGLFCWGVVLLAIAIYDGHNKDLFTLYSLDQSGNLNFMSDAVHGHPGIALYVAGTGGALVLIGAWLMRRSSEPQVTPAADLASTDQPTKRCPDCAEIVLAAAKVCKHCSYRFEDPEPSSA